MLTILILFQFLNQLSQLCRSHPPSDVLALKSQIDQTIRDIVNGHKDGVIGSGVIGISEENLLDFGYVAPSMATAQAGIKNNFGCVRTRLEFETFNFDSISINVN